MSRRCPSPAPLLPASPLDIDDLLRDILTRLPPRPSSLPRASLVCSRWHHLVSEPDLLRRLRAHHRKPPLLGVVSFCDGKYCFTPTLDPPDRIPNTRFSLPHSPGLPPRPRRPALPAAGRGHRVGSPHRPPAPRGFSARARQPPSEERRKRRRAVRFFFRRQRRPAPRRWPPAPRSDWPWFGSTMTSHEHSLASTNQNVVVGKHCHHKDYRLDLFHKGCCPCQELALLAPFTSDDILEFDFERQSLVVIKKPPRTRVTNYACCHIVRTGNGVLGLAILSEQVTIQIWEMNSNCHGVRRWMRRKTIQLEEQLSSLRPCNDRRRIISASILGYDDDTNMIVLSTSVDHFMVQLESSQLRNVPRISSNHPMACYPYSNFYIPEEKNQRIPTLRSQGFAGGGN